jgi:hypothetical protein
VAELLRQFGHDPTVRMLAGLVVLDLIFGVAASVVSPLQNFRVSYLVDFLNHDVLGKLVPYYGLWAVLHLVGDIEIGGFDSIEETVGAGIALALGASVLNSLRDLSLVPSTTSDTVAGPDPGSPTV